MFLFSILLYSIAFAVSIIIGIFFQSFSIVYDECKNNERKWIVALLIIFFFPVTIIMGILQMVKTFWTQLFNDYTIPAYKLIRTWCAVAWGFQRATMEDLL